MNPSYASLSLWGFPLLLGVLPLFSGCLDPLLFRMTVHPILPSSTPFFSKFAFFKALEWGGVYIASSIYLNIFVDISLHC